MSSQSNAAERANSLGLPQPAAGIALVLFVLGVLAFVAGLMKDPESTWLAFHSNFIFTTMLSCAGLTLAAIYTIVDAKWCGPYRRFAEGLAAWIPFAFVMALIGILGGQHIFEWYDHPMHGKEGWLNPTRVYLTDLTLLGLMTAFAFILGVMPLVTASGSGAVSRQVLGTVVLGGMLAATCISIFVVPSTFAVVEKLAHRFSSRKQEGTASGGSE